MDKHTFKVGDRVVAFGETKGYIVKPHDGYGGNWLVLRDDGHCGGYAPYYTYQPCMLKHDIDFRVGDWVRYEKIKNEGTWGEICFSDKTQVFKITTLHNDYHCEIFGTHNVTGTLYQSCYLDNLVKTQPPQVIIQDCVSYSNETREEKKMDIKRKADGAIVRGVGGVCGSLSSEYAWKKDHGDSLSYYKETEWEPVEEWVKIEVKREDWEKIDAQIGTTFEPFEAWGRDGKYCTVSWRPVK